MKKSQETDERLENWKRLWAPGQHIALVAARSKQFARREMRWLTWSVAASFYETIFVKILTHLIMDWGLGFSW